MFIIIFFLINQVIGTAQHHKFCVVGAGTAGIQLTAHLLHENQDVLLIESGDTVGSSWKNLPIDGKLRSVTHANQENAEWKSPAQERNDHVSILSPETLRIHPFQSKKKNGKRRQRVDAKEYQHYLQTYVQNHPSILNHMKTNTKVTHVKRLDNPTDETGEDEQGPFVLTLQNTYDQTTLQHTTTLTCDVVVWSVGISSTPNIPGQVSSKFQSSSTSNVMHYSHLKPKYGSSFSNKNVLIIGSGTSAFEVFENIFEYAKRINLVAGSEGIRLSIENGNPDGVPTSALSVLDHALTPGHESNAIHIHRVGCARDGWTLNQVEEKQEKQEKQDESHSQIRYRCLKRDHGWRPSAYDKDDHDRFEVFPHRDVTNHTKLTVSRKGGKKAVSKKRSYAEAHHDNTGTVGDGVYDTVILCTGFTTDVEMFDKKTCRPQKETRALGELPRMRPNYMSWNVPGLYFNGMLAHGRDFKRGAGGTLRGIRYTSRALSRILIREENKKEKKGEWPATTIVEGEGKDGIAATTSIILERMRSATGIYHMHEELCDVVTFDTKRNKWIVMEEVPMDMIPKLLQFGKTHAVAKGPTDEQESSRQRRYKSYMTLCYGNGHGHYSSSDAYPSRWRGDYEGDRAHHAKTFYKLKKIELNKGGSTGTGVDSDRLHPVLSYYELTNPVTYRPMEHGGPDRQSAVGYGISHVLFPLASLHIMDDPTFQYQLYYTHVQPIETWFGIYGKAMSSRKGWSYGNKMKKKAMKEGGLTLPRNLNGPETDTEVHVECYGMDYEGRRVIARTKTISTMQNVFPVPPQYNGGLLRIPKTSANRKMTLGPLTMRGGGGGNGGAGGGNRLGDGTHDSGNLGSSYDPRGGMGGGGMGGGGMGGPGGGGGMKGMPDPATMTPEQKKMYQQYLKMTPQQRMMYQQRMQQGGGGGGGGMGGPPGGGMGGPPGGGMGGVSVLCFEYFFGQLLFTC